MMAGFSASQVPHFTLYGDGTIIFRTPTQEMPPARGFRVCGPTRSGPRSSARTRSRTCSSTRSRGRALARPATEYDNPMVTDVGTTIFTIDAGGVKKAVNIYALGHGDAPGVPDMPARACLRRARRPPRPTSTRAARSRPTSTSPTAYRGILIDGTGMVDPGMIAWPWDDIKPADFKGPADPNALPARDSDADPSRRRSARRRGSRRRVPRACSSAGPDAASCTRSRCARCCRTMPSSGPASGVSRPRRSAPPRS